MFFNQYDREKLAYCHEVAISDELSIDALKIAVKHMEQDVISMSRDISNMATMMNNMCRDIATIKEIYNKQSKEKAFVPVKKQTLPKRAKKNVSAD